MPSTLLPPPPPVLARRWLSESDRVLIGAGAGLSAAAGIDYGDTVTFARLFPAMVKRGFRAQYQLIGYEGLSPEAKWGYWATHVNHVRFSQGTHGVYQRLLELVRGKDVFVVTSNVDALFERNGFAPERVYTPQGDYARMQCRTPCRRETWPTRPIVDRVLAALDPHTQEVTDPEAVPRCPWCGGDVFMNVRLDRAFLDEPHLEHAQRLKDWLQEGLTGRLLLLELGAGFNTPSVVRWRMEHLTRAHPGGRLIRVNPANPEVPEDLPGRALGLKLGAADALDVLC